MQIKGKSSRKIIHKRTSLLETFKDIFGETLYDDNCNNSLKNSDR